MALVHTTSTSRSRALEPIFAVMRTLAHRYAVSSAYHTTRRELDALSDRSLNDLGLSRGDIDRAALDSAIGYASRD